MAFTDQHNLDHHREHPRPRPALRPRPAGADRRRRPRARAEAVRRGLRRHLLPAEQHVDPIALMRSLHRRLVELGVRIVENAPLAGVRIDRDRITEITAGEERLSADAYVLAAGAWTGPLSTLIGVPAPRPPRQGLQHRRPSVRATQRDQPVGRQGRRDAAEPQPAAGRNDGVRRPRRGAQPDPDRRHPGGPGPLLPRLDPAGHPDHAAGGHPADDPRRHADHRAARPADQRATCPPATACRASRSGPARRLRSARLVLRGELPDVLLPFSPARFTRTAAPHTALRPAAPVPERDHSCLVSQSPCTASSPPSPPRSPPTPPRSTKPP